MPFQTLEDPNKRGPWEQEHLWHVHDANDAVQAAWITPPVAHLTDGPSGLAAYPGTGFPTEFDGTFLICDFLGGDAYSQVWRFGVRPSGAGYELVDPQIFIKSILPTDVEFGPDGHLYASDWWNGWQSDGKGRIYRVWHPESLFKPAAQEAVRVLREGFRQRSTDALLSMLDHDDRRLRQGAHLELAARGNRSVERLAALVREPSARQRPQMHALWALQIIARRQVGSPAAKTACEALIALCACVDEEIRAQAARAIGDAGCKAGLESVRGLMTDSSPRVRAFACGALGQLRDTGSLAELTAVLWENENADPWLRHAAATALARIGDRPRLQALAADNFQQVRLGAAIAMRQLRDPAIERLLFDPDPAVALEAARAIHDQPIPEAMPALALLGDRFVDTASAAEAGAFTADDARTLPLLRRVISANLASLDPGAPARLAGLAQSPRIPPAARLLAMQALQAWSAPGPRDPVLGRIRIADASTRDTDAWKRTLATRLPALAQRAPDEPVRALARDLAVKAGVGLDPAAALRTVLDPAAPASERIACLAQLEADGGAPWKEAIAGLQAAKEPEVRAAAATALARSNPEAALPILLAAVTSGERVERQAAVRALATIRSPQAEAEMVRLASALRDGTLEPALQLDVAEAAMAVAACQPILEAWRAKVASKDPLAASLISLEGGDVERGRRIVTGHVGAQCLRCHALGGGGGHAGPSLEGVATRHDRRGLLESLVNPNARLAAGFGPTSAMPTMNALLTPREIRDVVAYLSTLR